MKEIEKIFPDTIVANDDSKYGIVDNKGNIVVPFEMDDIVNISDEEFQAGYKHAETVMESFDASHDDIAEYIDQIHDELTDDFMTYTPLTGAAAYMTEKYIGLADVPKLNKNIKKLYNDTEKDGYYALFRTIDCLLPHPEDTEDFVVSFSEGNRPTFTSPDVRGEIGDIYLYEHGMHMFYVSANIYDSDDPDELLEECCILNVDNVVLSELLTCLQNEIDPDRTNKELSENILKAADLEGDHEIGHILTDCGVYMLKTEDTYVHWWDREDLMDITGYMNAVYVLSDGSLNIVYTDSDNFPTSAEIKLINPFLTRILDAIKAAANIAWNDYKNGK